MYKEIYLELNYDNSFSSFCRNWLWAGFYTNSNWYSVYRELYPNRMLQNPIIWIPIKRTVTIICAYYRKMHTALMSSINNWRNITAFLLTASDQRIPHGRLLKPYWNNSGLDQAHYNIRDARRSWKADRSPRLRDANFRTLHERRQKQWQQSVFDDIDKTTEMDLGISTRWHGKK